MSDEIMWADERRHWLTLHGRRISYLDFPGHDPAYLVLHGVGSSSEVWRETAQKLAADGSRVIVLDMPGHGQSSKEPGDYSLGSLASAARDLIEALNLGPVVLVGHSLGGGVALQFLYQYPAHVAGLVLVSSGGLGKETNWALRLASLPGSGVVIGAALNRPTMKAMRSVRSAVRKVTRRSEQWADRTLGRFDWLSEADSRHTFLSTLRSVVDHTGQRVSALEKLHLSRDVPTLIVWGRKDPIIPVAHGELAHSMLEQSRLVVFDEAGHEPHRTDPERFAAAVHAWWRRNRPVELATARPLPVALSG